ncbi:hypothetical protein [Paenibacillus turpanensis]|uniref:hypothetical protein n=1 Tax=Paenibacillus turpanensis TaxID=2689078 RepID=UPI00140A5643|nr:hypothetical protein [Paenibacillus turpanensis]
MPTKDEFKPETDGNPATIYEDTSDHNRPGQRINDSMDIGSDTVMDEEDVET